MIHNANVQVCAEFGFDLKTSFGDVRQLWRPIVKNLAVTEFADPHVDDPLDVYVIVCEFECKRESWL